MNTSDRTNGLDNEKLDINSADLSDIHVRAKFLMGHPLLSKQKLLVTEPVRELCNITAQAVLLRQPGTCFSAPSGAGKSKALKLAKEYLRQQWPNLYVRVVDMQTYQSPSVRGFFKHILEALKHPELRGETQDLRIRAANMVIDKAKQSGLNLAVLLIDEAQALATQELSFLKDFSNRLEKDDVQLVTVFMGQSPEFSETIESVQRTGRLDLIGRFLIGMEQFRSIQTEHDVREVLKLIDEAVYPEGSDWTWTRFFFPLAFDAGFRMENEAERLFEEATKKCIVRDHELTIPARQLFIAIKSFMCVNAENDLSAAVIPEDAWEKAIEKSHVIEAILSLRKKGGKDEDFEIIA